MAERKLDRRRARQLFLAANALVAAAVSAFLLVLVAGAGPAPAVGCLLVPGHGAWSAPAAASARPPMTPVPQHAGARPALTLADLTSAAPGPAVCARVR